MGKWWWPVIYTRKNFFFRLNLDKRKNEQRINMEMKRTAIHFMRDNSGWKAMLFFETNTLLCSFLYGRTLLRCCLPLSFSSPSKSECLLCSGATAVLQTNKSFSLQGQTDLKAVKRNHKKKKHSSKKLGGVKKNHRGGCSQPITYYLKLMGFVGVTARHSHSLNLIIKLQVHWNCGGPLNWPCILIRQSTQFKSV